MSWQKIQHQSRRQWRAVFPDFWDNIISHLEERPIAQGIAFGPRASGGNVILGFNLHGQEQTVKFQYHDHLNPRSNLCIISDESEIIIARNLKFSTEGGDLQNNQQGIEDFHGEFKGLFDKFVKVSDTIEVLPMCQLQFSKKSWEKTSGSHTQELREQNPIDQYPTSNEFGNIGEIGYIRGAIYLVFIEALIDLSGGYKFADINNPEDIHDDHDKIIQRMKSLFWAKDYARQSSNGRMPNGGTVNRSLDRGPMINDIWAALTTYRNVILEGVPGTGKTWYARKLSEAREGSNGGVDQSFLPRWITFHPAVAYEDFVEGIRPGADRSDAANHIRYFWQSCETSEDRGFNVRDGFFLRVCCEARKEPKRNFLVVIDEINRANLPNVLGDLLTLLEKDKRVRFQENGEPVETSEENWVTLPYSGRRFAVPANVYVLGTMNTSDKSIAPIDAALRRRFAFLTIEPMSADALRDKVQEDVYDSVDQWAALNGLLADCLGPDGRLGHCYLLQLSERIKFPENKGSKEVVKSIASTGAIRLAWQLELLPQLIDTLTTHGAIELFAADDGRAWLGAREQQTNDGHEVIKKLRGFIKSLGFDLVLQGDGHGKGLRVVLMGTKTDERAASAALPEAAE